MKEQTRNKNTGEKTMKAYLSKKIYAVYYKVNGCYLPFYDDNNELLQDVALFENKKTAEAYLNRYIAQLDEMNRLPNEKDHYEVVTRRIML